MNKQTTHRLQETLDDELFVKALETVLDYLWDDEKQHYRDSGSDTGIHIFQSLQIIRSRLPGNSPGTAS